jgi:hypothetical protein
MKGPKFFVISFVMFLLIFVPPLQQSVSKPSNQQLVFLLYNSREIYSLAVYQNVFYTLSKCGIETISWDLSRKDYVPELNNYPIVGVVSENLSDLTIETATNLKEYVYQGGRLIQFIRGYSEYLAELFSIDQKYKPTQVILNSIRFASDFIPGATQINLDKTYFTDDSFTYSFLSTIKPIALTNNGIPILWESSFGSGKTLFWNSSVLSNKAFRGFISASVSHFLPVSVRKIIGRSILFVDDFPSSSWRAKLEPTFSELGVTDTGFYSQVLLKDLIALAKEFSIHYSTVVVFNYNNIIKQPFTFFDWDNCVVPENGEKINVPEKILNQILSMPQIFEVGLHGYNHLQLTTPLWLQESAMIQSLSETRKKWLSLVKNPPEFYVPPMNEIDRSGFSALKTIFPEINTICSVYDADPELGQNRDFGFDPWDSQVIDIPRCTSGFYLNPYDRMIAYSTMEAFGIWTHFIHPDDIFSNPTNYPNFPIEWIRNQNNLPWYGESTGKNGLYYRFREDLQSMNNNFPWLDFSTIRNTRESVSIFNSEDATPVVTTQKVIFNNSQPQRYLIDLPEYISLEPNENIHVLSTSNFVNKVRILVEVNEGCSVNFMSN